MAIINLNEESSGKEIQLSANDIIEITLDEVPTTGYRWTFSQLDPDQFKVISEDYDHYGQAGIGGGGVKKIQLQVLGKSSGLVRLLNRQPWSGDVDKTFEFTYS